MLQDAAVPILRLVRFLPQENGSYAGFDAEEFTSRSGGKAAAVKHIKVSLGSAVGVVQWCCPLSSRFPAILTRGIFSITTCPQEKHGLSSLVMIGDGATDLEARQPGGADLFIGCDMS